MARSAKTPKFDEFNEIINGFGEWQKHDRKWQDYLEASKPLILELGCGKAALSMELARRYPDKNIIGVDRKSERLWRPAKDSLEEKLTNIAFVQTDLLKLEDYFHENSADEIWITFPDPYLRDRQAKHRMINPKFLDIYKKILKPNGIVKFKTDDDTLFDYFIDEIIPKYKSLNVLEIAKNLHESDLDDEYKIKTEYEKMWLQEGRIVKFISFKLS